MGTAHTVNVLRLVAVDGADWELAVGSLGSAITAGQIIDDETDDLVAGDGLDHGIDCGDDGDGVDPFERSNISDLQGLRRESGIADGRSGGYDLFAVKLIRV